MLIREVMVRDVRTCLPGESLARAAQTMWESDLGCVPIVDDEDHVVGMLTDRDVCLTAYMQGRSLDEIPISRAMSAGVFSCSPDQAVEHAEEVMREHQVRRLPVVEDEDTLVGIISLDDLALASVHDQALRDHVATTLAAICAPRSPPVATQEPPEDEVSAPR